MRFPGHFKIAKVLKSWNPFQKDTLTIVMYTSRANRDSKRIPLPCDTDVDEEHYGCKSLRLIRYPLEQENENTDMTISHPYPDYH